MCLARSNHECDAGRRAHGEYCQPAEGAADGPQVCASSECQLSVVDNPKAKEFYEEQAKSGPDWNHWWRRRRRRPGTCSAARGTLRTAAPFNEHQKATNEESDGGGRGSRVKLRREYERRRSGWNVGRWRRWRPTATLRFHASRRKQQHQTKDSKCLQKHGCLSVGAKRMYEAPRLSITVLEVYRRRV